MPARRLPLADEDRPLHREPVAELDVLPELERGVQPTGRRVHLATDAGGGADVDVEGAEPGGPEVVGPLPDLLDPPVVLDPSAGEEVVQPVVLGHLEHLVDRGQLGRVDEGLVTEHHRVVEGVVPLHVVGDLVARGHHVGVEPVDHVAVGGRRPGVARARPAPGLGCAHDPRPLRPALGKLQRLVVVVVDHHDLEQVLRVGLRGQRGQGVGQRVVGPVGGDDDADGELGGVGVQRGGVQGAPVVRPDPRPGVGSASARV